MPRSFSSGALSMLQKSRYFTLAFSLLNTLVIADVNVVLP